MDQYYILKTQIIIRKTQKKYFLIDPTQDYSKKGFPVITKDSVELLTYIREPHAFNEIIAFFGYSNEDVIQVKNFLTYLVSNSYVLTWNIGDDNQPFVSQLIRNEWYQEGVPYGATIELLPNCNFRCVHCYLSSHRLEPAALSTEEIKMILNKLKDIGIFNIYLSGGEPLLRKDFIEIYIYAKKLGFLISIFTNGYLINDELLQIFSYLPPMEIDVSLYGGCNKTYEIVTGGVKNAFSLISQNLIRLKKRGIFVSAKSPIMTLTENDIPLMISFCAKHNIPFRMSYDIHQTIDKEERNDYKISVSKALQLYKKYDEHLYNLDCAAYKKFQHKPFEIKRKRYLCGAGRNSCFVDYKGNIFPCIHTRHKGVNIFSDNIEKIWATVRSISYECLKDNEDYKCLSCGLITLCKSCPALREAMYGSALIVPKNECVWAQEFAKVINKGGE